jgi:hypothetical protein
MIVIFLYHFLMGDIIVIYLISIWGCPKSGSQIRVPNRGPKSGYQIRVPNQVSNQGPKSGSQIGVPNRGPKSGSQIGVPIWGPKPNRGPNLGSPMSGGHRFVFHMLFLLYCSTYFKIDYKIWVPE